MLFCTPNILSLSSTYTLVYTFSPFLPLSHPHTQSIFTMSDSPDDHESMSTTSKFFEIAHFLSGTDRASHVSWVVVVVTVATSVTRNWNKM